jgi:Ca2+-binding EF-hand superfamily protein
VGGQARSVEAIFHEKDSNGDGKLTLSEFSHEFPSRSGFSAQQVFVRLDADGDGLVTIEEFRALRVRR